MHFKDAVDLVDQGKDCSLAFEDFSNFQVFLLDTCTDTLRALHKPTTSLSRGTKLPQKTTYVCHFHTLQAGDVIECIAYEQMNQEFDDDHARRFPVSRPRYENYIDGFH